MTLKEILDEWNDEDLAPSFERCSYLSDKPCRLGVDRCGRKSESSCLLDQRNKLVDQLVNPVNRGFLHAVANAVRNSRFEDLDQWLGESGLGRPIANHANRSLFPPISPMFHLHARCAQFVLTNRRQRTTWTESKHDDHNLKTLVNGTNFPIGFLRELVRDIENTVDRDGGEGDEYPSGSGDAVRQVIVPFALVDKRSTINPVGVLAQFRMELVCWTDQMSNLPAKERRKKPVRLRDLYVAPRQAFLPMDELFRDALTVDAVKAVRRTLEADSEYTHATANGPICDVRIHIEDFAPEADLNTAKLLTSPLEGASAGAAAAWGLYFLLTGKVPDKGLIVLAQVASTGTLVAVPEGLEHKITAVARCPWFTTVVVSDESDRDRAIKARDKAGRSKEDLCICIPGFSELW